jgi:hypothetical protein
MSPDKDTQNGQEAIKSTYFRSGQKASAMTRCTRFCAFGAQRVTGMGAGDGTADTATPGRPKETRRAAGPGRPGTTRLRDHAAARIRDCDFATTQVCGGAVVRATTAKTAWDCGGAIRRQTGR